MSKTLTAKKSNKMKISIIALICALVFVASTVIGVFAATQQNVKSNFSITYEIGENVAVKVRTESYVPDLDSNNLFIATTDRNNRQITDNDGYVVFNATESSSEKEVIIPDVDLTPQTPRVEFLYTITNLNESGYVQYDLLENLDTVNTKNVITTAYYQTSDGLINTNSATTYPSTGWEKSNLLNLPAGQTTAVKYEIKVDDINKTASAAGTFGFKLIYTANATRDAGTVNRTALYRTNSTNECGSIRQIYRRK